VLFTVADSGSGFDPEELPQLFAPLGRSERPDRGGTGLGLALCERYVRLMGGTITADSVPGTGTTMEIRVPVSAMADRAGRLDSAPREVAEVLSSRRQRILLVASGDEREGLTRLLSSVGFQTRTAMTGPDAVDAMAHFAPDLAVLDATLRGLDVADTLTRMRAAGDPDKPPPILILHAAGAAPPDQAWAGVVPIAKPVRPSEVLERISDLLDVVYRYNRADTVRRTPTYLLRAADRVGADMAALPAPLRAELHDAVQRADLDRVAELVTEIRQSSPRLAEHIEAATERFEYAALLALFAAEPSP
jgi:DNA-binding response OmpR family regulator